MNSISFRAVGVVGIMALGLLATTARAELIGFYPFDDGTPLGDQSGQGNSLTSVGSDPALETAGGLSGAGYRFDGAQRLIAPIDINPTFRPSLTMGAWVRTSTLTPSLHKVMGHDDGGWDRAIGLDDRNGPFRYSSFVGNGPGPDTLPGPKSTDDWTFLAATYDDSSQIAIVYVDIDANTVGDELVVAQATEAFFGLGAETMGIGNLSPNNNDEGWLGYIDNAFIFDEILTAEQLTSIRNRGTPKLAAVVDPNFSAVSLPDLGALSASVATNEFSIPIRNDGALQPLHISSVTFSGPDAAYFGVQSFPAQLTPGQEGAIAVTLNRQDQVGAFHALLTIITDDSVQPRTTLDIPATVATSGTTDPTLLVETPQPIFGERPVGQATVEIAIRNSGAARTLNIAAATVVGTDAAHYVVNSFPASLAAGAAGKISVTFDSKDETKTFGAQLQLTSTDSAGRLQLVDLGALVKAVNIRSSLIGFYPFDDAANPKKDESGKGNNLTDPTGASATPPTHEPGGGYEGGAFVFDGSQLLEVPININPSSIPELTMGAWVKTTSLEPGLRKVIGHDNGAWDRTIGLDNRNGDLRYSAFTGSTSVGPIQGLSAPVNDQDWTFMAATYNQTSKEMVVYLDLDASTTSDALESVSDQAADFGPGFATAAIGDLRPDGPSEGWVGSIDNAFFYNIVLSEAQVNQIRLGGRGFILSGATTPAPQITNIAVTETGISLTWSSVAGASYSIDYLELLSGAWASIGIQASQGASTTFVDTDATRRGKPTGFYRVSVQP